MTRLHSPSCHSVSVKWQQLSADAPEPLQAPAQVQSLFLNHRLLVYGFIPHCTQVRKHMAGFSVGRTMYVAKSSIFLFFLFSFLSSPQIIICWQIFLLLQT